MELLEKFRDYLSEKEKKRVKLNQDIKPGVYKIKQIEKEQDKIEKRRKERPKDENLECLFLRLMKQNQ